MVQDFDPRSALAHIWELITAANKYIEDTKPWVLAKDAERASELKVFMYVLLETIRIVGIALTSFLPDTAEKILTLLQEDAVHKHALSSWGLLAAGKKLEKGEPLFPKIEIE
jgi:methionyl-tRNA synthetase